MNLYERKKNVLTPKLIIKKRLNTSFSPAYVVLFSRFVQLCARVWWLTFLLCVALLRRPRNILSPLSQRLCNKLERSLVTTRRSNCVSLIPPFYFWTMTPTSCFRPVIFLSSLFFTRLNWIYSVVLFFRQFLPLLILFFYILLRTSMKRFVQMFHCYQQIVCKYLIYVYIRILTYSYFLYIDVHFRLSYYLCINKKKQEVIYIFASKLQVIVIPLITYSYKQICI